jgi:hypothetical protein
VSAPKCTLICYDLMVPWSVRFTFSGDYYHDAYWSVGEQGFESVSHGCVNLAPDDAETYYNLAVPGDPITVTGSPKGGTWDNGWTEWFLSWPQFVQGSALHEAVEAGPGGSTFVDPATLPASTATAPLQTARPTTRPRPDPGPAGCPPGRRAPAGGARAASDDAAVHVLRLGRARLGLGDQRPGYRRIDDAVLQPQVAAGQHAPRQGRVGTVGVAP